MEKSAEAIDALDRAIRLHEKVQENPDFLNAQMTSAVSVVGKNQFTLERTGIMKILAEEQIKNGQITDGIATAEGALVLQKQFFSNMINF